MRLRWTRPPWALVGVLLMSLLALGPATGQVKSGKTRPLKTKTLMKAVVVVNCGAMKKALDVEPADEEAWAALAVNAELLNECGHILMADGRCPDKDWAEAAKTLQKCSAVALEAIEAKNADDAKSAFQAMTKACANCHAAHRG